MKLGLLIYDNDPNPDLLHKIKRAMKHFDDENGFLPEICYVNPDMLYLENISNIGIKVLPNQLIPTKHIWIGIVGNANSDC